MHQHQPTNSTLSQRTFDDPDFLLGLQIFWRLVGIFQYFGNISTAHALDSATPIS